ncbi:MAG: Tex family protein [Erysipelotrichaceae bacterium]|nr:Tex family protein [Erysipelotrichaceae bacterium]
MEQHYQWIASQLNVGVIQVKSTLDLLEEGNTVPFIARYRKEATKGLDEEQIRAISEHYQYQKNLAKRKEDVLRLIAQQGKMTAEIEKSVNVCTQLSEVEDIYRPYQQKRKTRASEAIANGLQGFADWMMSFPVEGDVKEKSKEFLNEKVETVIDAIAGAQHIIAEIVADDPEHRKLIRYTMLRQGMIVSKFKKGGVDEQQTYRMYYDFSERVSTIAPHRIMAINRGEEEKVLNVTLLFEQDIVLEKIISKVVTNLKSATSAYVMDAIKDGCKRLAFSQLEREIRNLLSEKAHEQSIDVFSKNLERLLVVPPLKDKMILGVDPAYRTGCKLVVIDQTGKVLDIRAIYPHQPVNKRTEAMEELAMLCDKYPVDIIAIGNGTASRETETLIAEFIAQYKLNVSYTIVSEAGASVYSASPLARAEFPDLQVEQRSAISIARRILDPLAELIKIDPQSIGVGQYQHDLPVSRLKERLDFTVSKTVNRVGVDLNTASQELLTHISGLNKTMAKNIVEYRDKNGRFKERGQLLKVKAIGDKAYEQAAGFLRIKEGKNWLDETAIHPESYPIVEKLMKQLELEHALEDQRTMKLKSVNITQTAKALNSDEYTISDIISTLLSPKRDYRDQYDGPLLRKDILTLNDLKEGMKLEGVVRNIVDFGVFVDIGLKNDGLVHISKLSKNRVRHPMDIASIGDIVTVTVIGIDFLRNKVQLSLIGD